MTTYYVRTPANGGDDSKDGSSATPWATIGKFFATASNGGGHTLKVGAGTYSENVSATGYLYIAKIFSAYSTVESESGANDVIIQGTSSASYNTYLANNAAYIEFKNVTFKNYATNSAQALRLVSCNHIKFTNCVFGVQTAAALNYACYMAPGAAATVQTIIFTNCTFSQTAGTAACHAINALKDDAGKTLDDLQFINCHINNPYYLAIILNGATNVLIDGGSYYGGTGYGIALGPDTAGANATTGIVRRCSMRSGAGHALIQGGLSAVSVEDCSIIGGDQGAVFKECDGAIVKNCNIIGGSAAAVYFKAAKNATVRDNTITALTGYAIQLLYNSTTGNKNQNCTVVNNKISALGAAKLFNWGGDSDDLGGGVCDYNKYKIGANLFGAVRADTNVADLTELRAAWAGYGDDSNDANSSMMSDDGGDFLLMLAAANR